MLYDDSVLNSSASSGSSSSSGSGVPSPPSSSKYESKKRNANLVSSVGSVVPYAGPVLSVASSLYSMYLSEKQRKEEKAYRDKVFDYNARSQMAHQTSVEAANNPSLQVSKMKAAGLNPNQFAGDVARSPASSSASSQSYNEVTKDNSKTLLELLSVLLQNSVSNRGLDIQESELDVSAYSAVVDKLYKDGLLNNQEYSNLLSSLRLDKVDIPLAGANVEKLTQDVKESESRVDTENVLRNARLSNLKADTALKLENKARVKIERKLAEIDEQSRSEKNWTSIQLEDAKRVSVELSNMREEFEQSLQKFLGLRSEQMSDYERKSIIPAFVQNNLGRLYQIKEGLKRYDPEVALELQRDLSSAEVYLQMSRSEMASKENSVFYLKQALSALSSASNVFFMRSLLAP